MKRLVFLFSVLLLLSSSFELALASGFQNLIVWNTEQNTPFEIAVWYPSNKASREINVGNFVIEAARDAKATDGKYPLIILSHESLGDQYSYNYLAAKLAESSYIVAVPKFIADNMQDMRLTYSFQALLGRTEQLSFTIDSLMGNKIFKELIDFNRIYLVAFGQASLSALVSVGANIEMPAYYEYCKNSADPFCNSYISNEIAQFDLDFLDWQNLGQQVVREEVIQIQEIEKKTNKNSLGKKEKAPEPQIVRYTVPNTLDLLREPRISALALVSPLYSMFFTQSSLTKVNLPVLIVNTPMDQIYNSPAHAKDYRVKLKTAPNFFTVSDANFHSFFAQCSESLRKELFELCLNQDEDTEDLQSELVSGLRSFFSSQN